ncbi:MAG: hypothetical protein ACM65M_22150 [Microcoleus sp.]
MSPSNQSSYCSCARAQTPDTTTNLQLIVEQLTAELNNTREQLQGEIHRLKTANETWQRAIGVAPILLWATDKNGKLTFAFGKGRENLGFSPEETHQNLDF